MRYNKNIYKKSLVLLQNNNKNNSSALMLFETRDGKKGHIQMLTMHRVDYNLNVLISQMECICGDDGWGVVVLFCRNSMNDSQIDNFTVLNQFVDGRLDELLMTMLIRWYREAILSTAFTISLSGGSLFLLSLFAVRISFITFFSIFLPIRFLVHFTQIVTNEKYYFYYVRYTSSILSLDTFVIKKLKNKSQLVCTFDVWGSLWRHICFSLLWFQSNLFSNNAKAPQIA